MDTVKFLVALNSLYQAEQLPKAYPEFETDKQILSHYTNLFQLEQVSTFTELLDLIDNNLFTAKIPLEIQISRYKNKYNLPKALEKATFHGCLEFVEYWIFATDLVKNLEYMGELLIIAVAGRQEKLEQVLVSYGATMEDDDAPDYYLLEINKPELIDVTNKKEIIEDVIECFARNGMFPHISKLDKHGILEENIRRSVARGIMLTGNMDFIRNPPTNFPYIPSMEDYTSCCGFPLCIGSVEMLEYFSGHITKDIVELARGEGLEIISYETIKYIVSITGPLHFDQDNFESLCSIEDDMKIADLFGFERKRFIFALLEYRHKALDAFKMLETHYKITSKILEFVERTISIYPDLELIALVDKYKN